MFGGIFEVGGLLARVGIDDAVLRDTQIQHRLELSLHGAGEEREADVYKEFYSGISSMRWTLIRTISSEVGTN